MAEIEKLYTVDDIAKMAMLTTRTIRTYLKEGLLTGRKVGGQWRFTSEDIEKLFENSAVRHEISQMRKQEVLDFIDGVNTDVGGDIQTCAIVDYYADIESAKKLADDFCDIISGFGQNSNFFYYEYIEQQQKARFTFIGEPSYILKAMERVKTVWKEKNKTQSLFSGKAGDYDKYRPSYPEEAVSFILSLADKSDIKIADIGSGTGKLSKLLLERHAEVFAVEPNPDMRAAAEAALSKYEYYHSLPGTGEATGLKTNEIDIITVAEAYHWFDNEQSRLEFKRILRDGGSAVLLWNRFGPNPCDDELREINARYCRSYVKKPDRVDREERAKHLFGENNYTVHEFDNTITEPKEAFIGGSLSTSCAPRPGDETYNAYITALGEVFSKHEKNGLIKLKIKTVCYCGKL